MHGNAYLFMLALLFGHALAKSYNYYEEEEDDYYAEDRNNNADYDCSENYEGKCYNCFYNEKICHRAGPHVIYHNGTIYSVDPINPNWHL